MKKNLNIGEEEQFLTKKMLHSFYPEQGRVVGNKNKIKETTLRKERKFTNNIGFKTMYSING